MQKIKNPYFHPTIIIYFVICKLYTEVCGASDRLKLMIIKLIKKEKIDVLKAQICSLFAKSTLLQWEKYGQKSFTFTEPHACLPTIENTVSFVVRIKKRDIRLTRMPPLSVMVLYRCVTIAHLRSKMQKN